jgi:hypothetical protein
LVAAFVQHWVETSALPRISAKRVARPCRRGDPLLRCMSPLLALNGLAISPDACLLLKAKQTSRGLHTHSLVPIAATASNPDEQNRDAAATNDCLNYGQTCGKRDNPSHPPVKPCTPQHRRHGNKSRSEIQRCVRLNARMVFRKQQYYAIKENQPEHRPRQRRGFDQAART